MIYDLTQLQAMENNLSWDYQLANNIDAADTSNWNAGAGFDPVGTNGTKFAGTFDGAGYTIDSLTIDRSTTDYVGLFGYTNGATVQNVGLTNVDVTGDDKVGGLVGFNDNSSNIDNSYATGSVTGDWYVGGLVGYNELILPP